MARRLAPLGFDMFFGQIARGLQFSSSGNEVITSNNESRGIGHGAFFDGNTQVCRHGHDQISVVVDGQGPGCFCRCRV